MSVDVLVTFKELINIATRHLPRWIKCALPTELSIYWGKEKLLNQHRNFMTSSTILVTLAPDKPLTSLPLLCNFTWSLYCFQLLLQKSKRAFYPWRASKFLADESKSTDGYDDSGSTVILHCINSLKCLHGIGGAGKYMSSARWPHSHKSWLRPNRCLTICQSHCIKWMWMAYYSIFFCWDRKFMIQVRSHYTVLHLITSNYSIINLQTYICHVKLLIIDEFSMTGLTSRSRISSASWR
jgi:hypothetical protein